LADLMGHSDVSITTVRVQRTSAAVARVLDAPGDKQPLEGHGIAWDGAWDGGRQPAITGFT
jgi:hypothetical protein